MPVQWDGESFEILNPDVGALAIIDLENARADRIKRARRSRGVGLAQLASALSKLGDGLGVSKSTLTNYETRTTRRTKVNAQTIDLMSLVLQYDPRALMMLAPFDHDDHDADLREAELRPALAGSYWPRNLDVPEGCRRFEVYERSRHLSIVVFKDPWSRSLDGGGRIDPEDERVLVCGDRVEAYNYVLHRLRNDAACMSELGLEDASGAAERAIPTLDGQYLSQYQRLLLLDGRAGIPQGFRPI